MSAIDRSNTALTGRCGASRTARTLALVPVALAATVSLALAAAPPSGDAANTLKEVGRAYESQRLLPEAERLAALQQLEPSVAALLQRGVDPGDRVALRFLAGRIADERGDATAAEAQYRRALDAGEHGPFGDDAEFALIRAMEASGRDAEAEREWAKWEKHWPASPLASEARLARGWNALRRGDAKAAATHLTALVTRAPWMTRDPRVARARAMAALLDGRPADALAALGTKSPHAEDAYVRGLALAAQGSLLRAAAAFQEAAERGTDSTLRDHARLAKANAFLTAGDSRSAAEEFARVAARVTDPAVRAEAELRGAGAVLLCGRADSALVMLRGVAERYDNTDVAARAQFLIGEALIAEGKPQDAIVELNRVLTRYFQHEVAAAAQYRVARCLDALGRHADATGAYQAVVRGYPLEPESPAAAYLAGVGLLDQGKPLAAAPYFQIVLDRDAARRDGAGMVVFASPEHQELVEASLCLLELSYHRTGNLGQLSGAPHVLLQRMPPSRSPWRAWSMLIDADASAAQARYPEAQATLEALTHGFPDHPAGASATRLLAWTYSQQGRDSLAIATEGRLLARWGDAGGEEVVSAAMLDIAHERFNQKRYREAAAAYEDLLRRGAARPTRTLALYQAGLCYQRMDRAGDAVDRWEQVVRDSADAPIAERAWARMGDVYFQAERYADARRAYQGLLAHFSASTAASLATLRLAQCAYNAGDDAAALETFASTIEHFPGTPAAREAKRGTELALYRLGRSPHGAEQLAKLVEQFPGSAFAADAQFQIARQAYTAKRWTEAADGFRRVVSQFPAYSAADQAQFLMGDAWQQARELDEARKAYDQFLSFFPTSELAPTVKFRLGLLEFESKDYAQAAVQFTRVLEDSAAADVRSASRYNLALCERLTGSTDEAKAQLERYRADFPGDARAADVAFQLGDLADAAGQAAVAAPEFERALASHPRPALAIEAAFRLGRTLESLGRSDDALHAYQQAAAAADRDAPFRLSAVARCAALYEARKETTKAIAAYRDILQNAKDQELVAAAQGRVSQLEAGRRAR